MTDVPAASDHRAVLIYETDSSQFADSAVEALRLAGIDCYRTGGALPGGSSNMLCLYIRNRSDFSKANELLVQLGAAIDSPSRVSPKVVLVGAIVAAVLFALFVLEFAK